MPSIRLLVVLSTIALCGGPGLASTPPAVKDISKEPLIMVNSETIWLQCHVTDQDGTAALPGFCDHLTSEFSRLSGRVVQTGTPIPDGARVIAVTVRLSNGYKAGVTLATGRQSGGKFRETSQQNMQLGSADHVLEATTATTLVYPMVQLLEAGR